MATAPVLCDYCRQAINLFSDDALLVGVYRRVDAGEWGGKPSELLSGDEAVLRFCSQQHMAEHAARVRLPAPSWLPTSDTKTTLQVLAGLVVALIVLGLAGLGVIDLISRFA